jgi:hypothetical protein
MVHLTRRTSRSSLALMRITLDIEDDVLVPARELARG